MTTERLSELEVRRRMLLADLATEIEKARDDAAWTLDHIKTLGDEVSAYKDGHTARYHQDLGKANGLKAAAEMIERYL